MKLIEISNIPIEGIIKIRGLLFRVERPEKNNPPQLMVVKSLSVVALVIGTPMYPNSASSKITAGMALIIHTKMT